MTSLETVASDNEFILAQSYTPETDDGDSSSEGTVPPLSEDVERAEPPPEISAVNKAIARLETCDEQAAKMREYYVKALEQHRPESMQDIENDVPDADFAATLSPSEREPSEPLIESSRDPRLAYRGRP